mgnify:CR=1 FL=1
MRVWDSIWCVFCRQTESNCECHIPIEKRTNGLKALIKEVLKPQNNEKDPPTNVNNYVDND